MGITNIGNNLNVLISCEYTLHDDWQTFATWYSIYKNLPDAEVSILCARDFPGNYSPFRWPTRAAVKFFQHENLEQNIPNVKKLNQLFGTYLAIREGLVKMPLLVTDCRQMCVRALSPNTVEAINGTRYGESNGLWFFQDIELGDLEKTIKNVLAFGSVSDSLNHYLGKEEFLPELSNSADDPSVTCFTNFSKFENFDLDAWRADRKSSPFVYSQGMASPVASPNARRLLLLWDRMKAAYEVMR